MTQRTELRKMFGAFWNVAWKDTEFYDALVTSMEFLFNRLERRVDELPLFLSRFDLPPKAYKETDYVRADEITLARKYLELGDFDMDAGRTLDELKYSPSIWAMPAPSENISVITDSPVAPQVLWHRGTDFDIVDGELQVYADPFQDAFRQHIQEVDGENLKMVDLWMLDTTDDKDYLSDHYGRVIGMVTPSSNYFKRILNAVYDLLQEGATRYRLAAFIGAIVDTDVCRKAGFVEEVWAEGSRTWVSVDDVLHSCPGTGRALVSKGDAVVEGSLLFDVFDISSGREEVDPGVFPQLILGPAYLSIPSGTGLSFENASLEVDSYQFPIGGFPEDVAAFWEAAEAEATARGIDLHEAIIGDQKQPWTINPFEFIRENFLSTSTMFITLDVTVVPDQEALKLLRYLDEVLPAGTTYFMNVFGVFEEEDIPTCSDEDEPGFLANDADEVDIITVTDYVKGSEKLY